MSQKKYTVDGRKLRSLNIIDEHTKECLANIPRRSWRGRDMMEALADIMLQHDCPEYVRSGNDLEEASQLAVQLRRHHHLY